MPNGERHAPMAVDLRGCIYRHVHGKKIQAIKRYRELTGTSLREAKAVIDSL